MNVPAALVMEMHSVMTLQARLLVLATLDIMVMDSHVLAVSFIVD